MALSINTNVASLNAQRNLSRSQETLNTSLQRLSTGLRINSAKDDAAGLAITTRFTTQINGLNQAVRNANDGISLAQTGEAALDEITNNLQRVRELAVQSANSTYSASDRAALDSEVQQRLAEIDRIASQTSFNGQKILDGSFGTASFQVGANVGETISVNLSQGARSNQIGQIATNTFDVSATAFDGQLEIAVGTADAVTVAASTDYSGSLGAGYDDTSAYSKARAINDAGIEGLTTTAVTEVSDTFTTITGGGAGDEFALSLNGVDIYGGTAAAFDLSAGDLTAGTLVSAINQKSDETGVTASVSGSTLTLTSADGRNITTAATLTDADTSTSGGFGAATIVADVAGTSQTNRGALTLTASEAIDVTDTGGVTNLADIGIDSTTSLASASVDTISNSNTTISRVDAALESISDLRSDFGAVQNRFESTITNLQTISENLSASRGRILDADFAAETANLTKAQILQQAGTSILAQANSLPQSVLSLLQ
ncbi:flagellin [Spongiibacter nanhainus]|uniref:Flagellin n=1 Tax=Spongiibacter nanhainus TaxID=2794344 RepID=A0A7T4R3X9_9GAMM|nr:flagellin [Spongiibacter nanhainus]QQD19722.1 flagellin [Spongiibacter nanhainus]